MSNTFNMRRTDHTTTSVDFYPVLALIGTDKMRFALHRTDGDGSTWALSDIPSGVRVLTVKATYKGMPVHSGCLTVAEARSAARKQLLLLVEGVGVGKFKNTLEATRTKCGCTPNLVQAAKDMGKLVVVHVGGAQ